MDLAHEPGDCCHDDAGGRCQLHDRERFEHAFICVQLENGNPHEKLPYKHTLLMKPGEKLSALITPIEKGDWAFHCHLLYHMEGGMFQVMRVV